MKWAPGLLSVRWSCMPQAKILLNSQVLQCSAVRDIHLKLILNPNLAKSNLSVTYFSVIQSFRNFAQSMAVILLCSVQIFKTIGQLKGMLFTNDISQDLSWRKVSDRYSILHSTPGSSNVSLPSQVQLTDFENAAYVVFIVLMTRVILSFKLNLLIPISKVTMVTKFKRTF